MGLYELERLHKHTARTAARVVYFTVVWLNEFGYKVDNRFRGIVFTFALSFGDSKLAEKEFVNASNQVVVLVFLRVELVYFIEQRCKLCPVES